VGPTEGEKEVNREGKKQDYTYYRKVNAASGGSRHKERTIACGGFEHCVWNRGKRWQKTTSMEL